MRHQMASAATAAPLASQAPSAFSTPSRAVASRSRFQYSGASGGAGPSRSLPTGSSATTASGLTHQSEPRRSGAASTPYQSSSVTADSVDKDIDVDQIDQSLFASATGRFSSRLRTSVREQQSLMNLNSNKVPESLPKGDGAGTSVFDELVGFQNIGNTCFMNSTLQCLLRTQRLRKFLLSTDLDRISIRPSPLTNTLQDICRRMFSSSGAGAGAPSTPIIGKSMAPSNFKNCLASYKRAFAGTEQHDAHEFLRFTLDAMHDECNAVTKRPPYEELKDIDREEVRDTAARWLQNHLKRNTSVVQDAFCGQFASETVCSECSHRSTSCETFLDLSVSIPRSGFGDREGRSRASDAEFSVSKVMGSTSASSSSAVSLHAALDEFFAPVDLAGDDAYRCPKCSKPTTARRTTKLFQVPEVLVVHLKRFRHSRFHATKINDLVKFPVEDELSVSQYLHRQSPHYTSVESCQYTLTGVVHHMGSVHSGHYIAHCRCYPKGTANSTRWYEFNDSSVSAVRDAPEGIIAPSAYLLFYERTPSRPEASKL